MIDTPLVGDSTNIQPRAYSIASAPHEQHLQFLIKRNPVGRFGQFLETIEEGSELTIKGPLGLFTIKPTTRKILFVATGAGLAPFRSQILSLLVSNHPRSMTLIHGVASEQDLFCTKELDAWQQKHPQFSWTATFSDQPSHAHHRSGRVQAHLASLIEDPLDTDLYVCGNPAMMKEVKELGLALGIPRQQVHGEGFV